MDKRTRDYLLRMKKSEESPINRIVVQRGVQNIVHFTRVENLESILINGFLPIEWQINKGVEAKCNDIYRIDSMLHSTSFSIEFPNYKLFYRFRTYDYPGTKWVVIFVNKNVLFSDCNIPYFCKSNAAGLLFGVEKYDEYCTAQALNDMFCDEFVKKDNTIIHRSNLQLRSNFTTDPQAEVLISDIVKPIYIDQICFYSIEDIIEYKKTYGDELLKEFDYQTNPGMFDARKDYRFW